MDEFSQPTEQPLVQPAPAPAPQPAPEPMDVAEAPVPQGSEEGSDVARGEPDPAFAAKRYAAQRDRERENSRLLQEQIRTQQQQTEALVKLVESVVGQRQQPPSQEQIDSYQPRDGEDNSQYFTRLIQQLVTDVNETKQERAERLRAEEQQRQRQQFEQAVAQEYRQFAAEAPDLTEAATHLVSPLEEMWKAAGLTDAEIASEVARQEHIFIAAAKRKGMNPGALIYDVAKARKYVPAAERAARAEAAAKRQAAEAARGIGGGGAGASAPSRAAMADAFNKAPPGSPERQKLLKDILTP